MRIADNTGDHGGLLFSFILSFFCFFVTIGMIKANSNTQEETHGLLIILSFILFFITLNMGLAAGRDYWIDQTGVYVRILGGKLVRRKLLVEEIRFFGVILVISGKFEKKQIVFSRYIPRRNSNGYAIRLRGTIPIDYTPELYEEICRHYTPESTTLVVFPGS